MEYEEFLEIKMTASLSKMAGFKDREKNFFPLTSISSVVNLFKDQLERPEGPNLALLSITLGCIENTLTLNRAVSSSDESALLRPIFPVVDLETVDTLYTKFLTLIKGSIDLSSYPDKCSSRELVKKISDVIWGSLSRSFKDKAHLQSLYSFLTGKSNSAVTVVFSFSASHLMSLSFIPHPTQSNISLKSIDGR